MPEDYIEDYYKRKAEKRAKEQAAAPIERENLINDFNTVNTGGFNISRDTVENLGNFNVGLAQGKKLFSENPEIQRMQQLRQDMEKGYSGNIGGAIRQTARGEIAGAQQAQARKLASAAAREGVGGARGAALQAANAREGSKAINEAERKMAVDSFNVQQTGVDKSQDFLFRKLMGEYGTGAGFMAMGSADKAAAAARAANTGGGKK